MKRLIALLLIFSLVCAVFPMSISAAESDAEINEAHIEAALAYANEHPEIIEELPTEEQPASKSPALRTTEEDNLIMPGPLMEGCAAKRGDTMHMTTISYVTGKSGQRPVALIFRGKDLSKDPVEVLIGSFSSTPGVYETKALWKTAGFAYGTYTVVTCTATNDLVLVEGTSFAELVYVVKDYLPVTSIYLADENGNRLDKLTCTPDEPVYAYVKHEPAITTSEISLTAAGSNGVAAVEEYCGLVFASCNTLGWDSLSLTPNGLSIEKLTVDVEACIVEGGHHAEQTVLAKATEAYEGGTLLYCPDCFTSKIAVTESNSVTFYQLYDMKESEWYYDYVKSAVGYGLFNGVSAHKFAPESTMTRAMLVTVLWRYAGSPKEGSNTFADVKNGEWYTDAVAWAAHNKVVDGVGNNRFAPDDPVTREQMAAILFRYTVKEGFTPSEEGTLSNYADGATVSPWAISAMQWCIEKGIIGGMSVHGQMCLVPQGNATRAEVATILTRFIEGQEAETYPLESIDTSGAEDFGTYGELEWAFFPDGTLEFAGECAIPLRRSPYTGDENKPMPWDPYISRTKKIRLLNGITYVGRCAFENYTALESVEAGHSLEFIAEYAFSGCTSLTEVILPDTLEAIEGYAFSGCCALKTLQLPTQLRLLGECAFSNCTALEEISLPDTLFTHYRNHYSSSPAIGDEVFSNCISLTEVRLPLGMKTLPDGFFLGCTSLETVEFPKGLSSIRCGAFANCNSLKTLVLPITVYTLADDVFTLENNSRPSGYVDTCGLTDIYIFNPLLTVTTHRHNSDNEPVWDAPFGNPENVTVHAYAGTEAEWLATEMGYNFVPIQ